MVLFVSYITVLSILVVLGGVVALQSEDKENAGYFLFSLVAIVLWVFTHLGIHTFPQAMYMFLSPELVGRLILVFGLVIAGGLLIFSLYFPFSFGNNRKLSRRIRNTVAILLLVLIPVIIGTPFVVDDQYGDYGFLYLPYAVLVSMFLLGSVFHLYGKCIGHEGEKERRQLKILFSGVALSSIWVFFTNILIPLFTGATLLNPYGPLGIIFFAVLATYAIIQHRLFRIRILTSEIFLGVIGIVLIILTGTSQTFRDLIINGTTLIIYGVVAYLLYRELLHRAEKEKQLAEKNKELKRILETKDDFLRMVSHQLRTPMTSLSGFLSMLVDRSNDTYVLNDEAYEQVVRVYINTQRLSAVVNDILFTNAINAEKFGVSTRKMNLKETLESVLENKQVLFDFYEVDTSLSVKGGDFSLSGDPMKLKEALNTLIDNAVYYGNGKIDIILKEHEETLECSIEDNGIGITDEERSCVWQKFARSERAKRRSPNSSGLALFVTQKTVKLHGGSLVFESAGEDQGSTFCMTLPKENGKASDSSDTKKVEEE